MSLLSRTTQVFLVQALGGSLSVLTSLFLAWMLSPADKGASALLVVVPGLIVVAANLGFQASATYFAAKRTYPLSDLLSTTIVLTIAISTVVALLIALTFSLWQEYVFHGIPTPYVLLSLSVVPSYLLVFYLGDIFWAADLRVGFTIVRVTPTSTYFLAAIVLVGVFQLGLLGATVAFALSMHGGGLLALILAKRAARLRWTINRPLLTAAMRYGLKTYIGKIAQQSTYRLDLPLVNYFAGASAAGYYSVAVALAEIVWYVPQSVGYVLFPRVAQSTPSEATRVSSMMIRHTLYVSCLVSGIYLLVINAALPYFFPAYGPAFPLFCLLLPGIVFSSVFQLVVNDLMGRGKPVLSSAIAFSGLGCGLLLYFLLIPQLGAVGAALASTVTYVVEAIVALVLWSHRVGVHIGQALIPTRQDILIYWALWRRAVRTLSLFGHS